MLYKGRESEVRGRPSLSHSCPKCSVHMCVVVSCASTCVSMCFLSLLLLFSFCERLGVFVVSLRTPAVAEEFAFALLCVFFIFWGGAVLVGAIVELLCCEKIKEKSLRCVFCRCVSTPDQSSSCCWVSVTLGQSSEGAPFVKFLPDLEFRKHSWGVENSEMERVGESW